MRTHFAYTHTHMYLCIFIFRKNYFVRGPTVQRHCQLKLLRQYAADLLINQGRNERSDSHRKVRIFSFCLHATHLHVHTRDDRSQTQQHATACEKDTYADT